jgi:hypothetical protein
MAPARDRFAAMQHHNVGLSAVREKFIEQPGRLVIRC